MLPNGHSADYNFASMSTYSNPNPQSTITLIRVSLTNSWNVTYS